MSLQITNHEHEPLKLLGCTSSCGCLVDSGETITIAPGGIVERPVTFDFIKHLCDPEFEYLKLRSDVYVHINRNGTKTRILNRRVTGIVRPPLKPMPTIASGHATRELLANP